jgi:hypothetical protein
MKQNLKKNFELELSAITDILDTQQKENLNHIRGLKAAVSTLARRTRLASAKLQSLRGEVQEIRDRRPEEQIQLYHVLSRSVLAESMLQKVAQVSLMPY